MEKEEYFCLFLASHKKKKVRLQIEKQSLLLRLLLFLTTLNITYNFTTQPFAPLMHPFANPSTFTTYLPCTGSYTGYGKALHQHGQ